MTEESKQKLTEWVDGNQLGIDIVTKKYLQDGEEFDHWVDRITGGDADFKRLLLEKKFLPGGRILANRGLSGEGVKSSLSNCYVIDTKDNIEAIYKTCSDMARTYSYGGGVGVDLSPLRPRGASVNNTAKETTGAVSFMKTFDVVTGTIGQSGRRGALMLSISVDHPDVYEFVDVKANTDEINNANISVRVNDKFMKAVESDSDYLLHWPCDMDINEQEMLAIKEYGKLVRVDTQSGPVYLKKIKAKDLFNKLVKNNWDYAEPGILYWDRIEKYHLMSENKEFKYAGTNPCVSGDTLILTEFGYKRIDELVGKKVNIWNGFEWSEVEPRMTGKDQNVKRFIFSNGSELICTYTHKFVLNNGERKEAAEIHVGDKVAKYNFPVIESGDNKSIKDKRIPYTQGFFSGDGYYSSNKVPVVYLYGENKQKLQQYIVEGVSRKDENEDRVVINLPHLKEELSSKDYVPAMEYSVKERLEWLSGLIDADGSRSSKEGGISISSVNKNFLLKVQRMLHTLGTPSVVTYEKPERVEKLPTHNDDVKKEYYCKQSYRLLVSPFYTIKLLELGLICHRVDLNATPRRNAGRFVTIVDIQDAGVEKIVYCFTEHKNHTGIFNGIMTGQCGEEPLPSGGACLLGSMNLYEYVNNDKQFDYELFDKDCRIATKALNAIQIEGIPLHPLEGQRVAAKKYRQIGLGLFDLGGALIKMGIRYGSELAQRIAEKIAHTMLIAAFEKSCDLNDELGIHVIYPNMFDSEFYKTRVEPFIAEKYKGKYPLNSQLLTIAPTGTISTMINATSGGGEPMFATSYIRNTKSIGEKAYKVYPKAVLDYYGGDVEKIDEEKLPEFFVTAGQLNPIERVKMQGALQKNIDASISSTVNLNEKTTVEEVYDIYMNAWKYGLKGITIFRDNCKRAAILTTSMQPQSDALFNTVDAPKRPKVLDADFYQVRVNGENFRIFVGLYDGKPYELFAMPCADNERIPNHKGKITREKKRVYKYESEFITVDNVAIELGNDYDIFGEIDKISNIVNEGKTLKKSDIEIVKESVYNIKNWSEKREYRNVALHISANLRTGMRLEDIIKLEEKCNDNIVSFNKAVSRVLSKYLKPKETDEECPECHSKIRNEGGCLVCPNCGWSKCS